MGKQPFWNAQRSTTLSIIVGVVALVLAVACLAFLGPLLSLTNLAALAVTDSRTIAPLYACLVCGIAAVVVLLGLLGAIRRGQVFTLANVRRLRLISYCGFLILGACAVGAILSPFHGFFLLLAAIAGFLGLLMRVIKNVIDAARLLKEDADFTI